MTVRSVFIVSACSVLALAAVGADTPRKPGAPAKADRDDAPIVEAVIASRKNYQEQLLRLYDHYVKVNDRERAKWVTEELKSYHLAWKPSYRLDILDVPPANLVGELKNEPKANDLFKLAMEYKAKRDTGNDYILNQRRAELLFQDVLQNYRTSDKLADVAYELGDLYEGKAYRQYDRAALYFERAFQWRTGTRSDARLRAARLYDRQLNERSKAVELYRDEIQHDTEPTRLKEAEKRLGELTGTKK